MLKRQIADRWRFSAGISSPRFPAGAVVAFVKEMVQ